MEEVSKNLSEMQQRIASKKSTVLLPQEVRKRVIKLRNMKNSLTTMNSISLFKKDDE